MTGSNASFLVMLLAAAAADAAVAFAAWRRGTGLAALMTAAFVYACGDALALVSGGSRLFWGGVAYLGLAALPPAWVMTAWARKGRLPARRTLVILFIVPAASLGAYTVSGCLHLYAPALVPVPALIRATAGPWFGLFALFAGFALALGNILYARRPQDDAAWVLPAGSLLLWTGMAASAFPGNVPLFGPVAVAGAGLVLGRHLPFPSAGLTRRVTPGAVFQGLREGVLVLDTQNRIVNFNPAARSILPDLSRKSLGRPAAESLRDRPELLELLLDPGCRPAESQLPLGKGLKYYQAHLSPLVRRGRLIGKAVIMYDVTHQTWRVDELETKASMDALTGISNRAHLLERGRREIQQAALRSQPVSFVLLDIDHFKNVNDTYGHSAGDVVLKKVVAVTKKGLRSRDLLGRWGGEEFVVILPGTPPAGALVVAERIRREIAASALTLQGSATISVTASFGVVGLEKGHGADIEELLTMADQALYQAKNSGRNRVVQAHDKGGHADSLAT